MKSITGIPAAQIRRTGLTRVALLGAALMLAFDTVAGDGTEHEQAAALTSESDKTHDNTAAVAAPATPSTSEQAKTDESAAREPHSKPTLDELRRGMAEAKERREALLEPDPAVAEPAIRKGLVDKWGVEVLGARKAAKGYMIDFRFRVLDADKAMPLFDSRTQPYLLTEGSNIRLPVPVGQKVGAFRATNRGKNITAGRDYYMMFANPDAFVREGQKVSVVIGDFRVDNMTLR